MTTDRRGLAKEAQRYTFPNFEVTVEWKKWHSLPLDNIENEMPPLASLLFNGYDPVQPKRNLSAPRLPVKE